MMHVIMSLATLSVGVLALFLSMTMRRLVSRVRRLERELERRVRRLEQELEIL